MATYGAHRRQLKKRPNQSGKAEDAQHEDRKWSNKSNSVESTGVLEFDYTQRVELVYFSGEHMKDFQASGHNLQQLMDLLQAEIAEHKLVIVSSQPANTGKWGMARLWRAWMSKTAEFMSYNGVKMPLMYSANGEPYGSRPFNADDAHELFTRQHLGVDENGERLSWAKSGSGRVATKAERFHAMQKHEAWCSERGIILLKPRESEYSKLEQEHDGI